MHWNVPCEYNHVYLELIVRFCNKEQVVKKVFLKKSKGTFFYCLLNEEYFQKGGIKTYRVRLISENSLLEEWRHQLWTELIVFEEPPSLREEVFK